MKKQIMIMFLLTIVLLSGCGLKKKEIAVLLYSEEDPFIRSIENCIVEKNITNYNIKFYNCKNSQVVQNEIAENLYNKGVDLLIINPVERLSSYIFVEKSRQYKVPLIFFNREPLKEDIKNADFAYYVGADAKQSGILQANLIAKAFGNNPEKLNQNDKNKDHIIQAVILKGEQGHQDAEVRTKVVIEELNNRGYQVEVLNNKIANWKEEEAYAAMDEIMKIDGAKIEVLIANNDAMAIGATRYLMENGYLGKKQEKNVRSPFIIVGIDGLDTARELTQQGYMYGTILNDGNNMAQAILELSEHILDQKELNYKLVDNTYIWIPYKDFSGKE